MIWKFIENRDWCATKCSPIDIVNINGQKVLSLYICMRWVDCISREQSEEMVAFSYQLHVVFFPFAFAHIVPS